MTCHDFQIGYCSGRVVTKVLLLGKERLHGLQGLVTNYGDGGGGATKREVGGGRGQVKFYPYEKVRVGGGGGAEVV